ncbi:Lcl C-terminal domain-containing protein [Ideonella paludis]|uniref:DUF1566 domain-containing protein n=1 Tax=Ideonella paludis TaxID=1233411 RepID=A0ABS5DUP8_9BURK|nr:DUF1566 domain-containing protein [Ideonella paludis]MBQ0934862.1 DUF1566 domain-containing protein [Ideonella paludis]
MIWEICFKGNFGLAVEISARWLFVGLFIGFLSACGGGSDIAPSTPVVNISGVNSDVGWIPSGGAVSDSAPQLSGILSSELKTGERLQIFDGDIPLSPFATVDGLQWKFIPFVPLAEGEHRFSAAVVNDKGFVGARGNVFVINVNLPDIVPTSAIRAASTVIRYTDVNLAEGGFEVIPKDDSRGSCEPPLRVLRDTLEFRCTFYIMGRRTIEIRQGGVLKGAAEITIESNVTEVVWSSPTTGGYGQKSVRNGEAVSLKVIGSGLLLDPQLDVVIESCSNVAEQASASDTERVFSCEVEGVVSNGNLAAAVMSSRDGQALIRWQMPVTIDFPIPPLLTGKLPHTGITGEQCFKAGSDVLVSCRSPEAIALSGEGKQDGMRGANNPLGYSTFGRYGKDECVVDKVTGLMWEGTTGSGFRSVANRYSNVGDGRLDDASSKVAAVNASGLCGFHDWRLPTIAELHNLVDFSLAQPGPVFNHEWFGLSPTSFWASTVFVMDLDMAWTLTYEGVPYANHLKNEKIGAVRLVRSGQ